jgi:hypothetical protein
MKILDKIMNQTTKQDTTKGSMRNPINLDEIIAGRDPNILPQPTQKEIDNFWQGMPERRAERKYNKRFDKFKQEQDKTLNEVLSTFGDKSEAYDLFYEAIVPTRYGFSTQRDPELRLSQPGEIESFPQARSSIDPNFDVDMLIKAGLLGEPMTIDPNFKGPEQEGNSLRDFLDSYKGWRKSNREKVKEFFKMLQERGFTSVGPMRRPEK